MFRPTYLYIKQHIQWSPLSLKHKEKLKMALTGKKHILKTVTCPHCEKVGSGPNMTRYHFDNCKEREI